MTEDDRREICKMIIEADLKRQEKKSIRDFTTTIARITMAITLQLIEEKQAREYINQAEKKFFNKEEE